MCNIFFFPDWNSSIPASYLVLKCYSYRLVVYCMSFVFMKNSLVFSLFQNFVSDCGKYKFLFCSSNWKITKIALKMESILIQTNW